MQVLTHAELVERAVKWLKNSACYPTALNHPFEITESEGELAYEEKPPETKLFKVKCSVVFAEIVTSASETPDAIGFFYSGNRSILIECKASVSDYYSDRSKPFRKSPELGIGDWRWYMTPKGLINDSWELPAGWGLLEVCGKVVRAKRLPTKMGKNLNAETNILWSAVRRLQIGKESYSKPVR